MQRVSPRLSAAESSASSARSRLDPPKSPAVVSILGGHVGGTIEPIGVGGSRRWFGAPVQAHLRPNRANDGYGLRHVRPIKRCLIHPSSDCSLPVGARNRASSLPSNIYVWPIFDVPQTRLHAVAKFIRAHRMTLRCPHVHAPRRMGITPVVAASSAAAAGSRLPLLGINGGA